MKGLLASQTPQGRLGTTHERCSRKTHRNLATKTDEEMDLAVGEGLFWPSFNGYSNIRHPNATCEWAPNCLRVAFPAAVAQPLSLRAPEVGVSKLQSANARPHRLVHTQYYSLVAIRKEKGRATVITHLQS
jgi:hypothetical protein